MALERKCTANNTRKRKKCSPVVELHHASLKEACGGGVGSFSGGSAQPSAKTIKLMIVTVKLIKVDGS